MAQLLTQEKLEALRSEYKYRSVKGKYPRQKMLPEYQSIYPWVMADEVDPYFAFCTLCECRLSAKRSDLGKHEGSIKHTENASRRFESANGQVGFKGYQHAQNATDDGTPYIKQELESMESSSNSASVNNLKTMQPLQEMTESSSCTDDDEDDDGEDDSCEPSRKRHISEADPHSQHSSMPQYLPVEVTITEGAAASTNAAAMQEHRSTHFNRTFGAPTNASALHNGPQITSIAAAAPMLPTTQTPCKITIKKITQPRSAPSMAGIMSSTVSQQAKLTSGAQLAQLQTPASAVARDAYDLFFESICASVKALPPKLATEGKIRVMQLVGELELRAITEHEQNATALTASRGGTEGQQNSTVASTTK